MLPQLPDNRHDCILWLFEHLEDVTESGEGRWRGRLPAAYNYDDVVAHFDELGGSAFAAGNDSAATTIEFVGAWGHVYADMTALLHVARNQRVAPDQFTVLKPKYTHAKSSTAPPIVALYLDTVKLCQALLKLSDHQSSSGEALHYIHRHDAKLTVRLTYSATDLIVIPYLHDFCTEYVDSTLHIEQKRNIFRSSLLDVFKGKVSVTVGELLPKFAELYGITRDSYAMYAADFSVERMRRELEKLNLDDTLRLNKTLSEIQNQLLALPAALILASASISTDNPLRTVATVIGIAIFTSLMLLLITNQKYSVNAISAEIDLRKDDFSSQPATVAERYSNSIEQLKRRSVRQLCVLRWITIIVFVVFISVLGMAFLAFFNRSLGAG